MLDKVHGRAGGRLGAWPLLLGFGTCSEALIRGAHALAERRGVGWGMMHRALHPRLATRDTLSLARLDALGVLGPRTKLAHMVYVDETDIANVKVGPAIRFGEGSVDGKQAVVLAITKQPRTNTIELTNAIDRELDAVARDVPKGITIERQLFRQAEFISTAVDNVAGSIVVLSSSAPVADGVCESGVYAAIGGASVSPWKRSFVTTPTMVRDVPQKRIRAPIGLRSGKNRSAVV